jgi:hypothetical protein
LLSLSPGLSAARASWGTWPGRRCVLSLPERFWEGTALRFNSQTSKEVGSVSSTSPVAAPTFPRWAQIGSQKALHNSQIFLIWLWSQGPGDTLVRADQAAATSEVEHPEALHITLEISVMPWASPIQPLRIVGRTRPRQSPGSPREFAKSLRP